MKIADALALIEKNGKRSHGFRVSFDRVVEGGAILESDYTPACDEPPFKEEEQAWEFAAVLAKAGQREGLCNFYVVFAADHVPVPGWFSRRIPNREECRRDVVPPDNTIRAEEVR